MFEAVAALPEAQRDGATIVSFDENGDGSISRHGTDNMICWADEPAEGFSVRCFSRSVERMMVWRRQLRGKGTDEWRDVVNREIQVGELPMPDSEKSYSFQGPPFDNALPLTVIGIPYATRESTGLSIQPNPFRPYLMRLGEALAHIMLNGK